MAAMATNPTSESNCSKPTIYLQDKDEVQRVFNQFDVNGDGKISDAELGDALKTLGSEVSSDELRRVMTELDTDNDGFINFEEFAAFCRSRSDDDGATELRDAFDLYDQDRNGLISVTELHSVLNRIGMGCSIEDCHRMIKSVDSDGDDNVNFDEFKQMMTNKASNASVKA